MLTSLIASGEGGLSMAELQEKLGKDVCKIGMGNCLKNKWAKKEKDGRLVAIVGEVKDEVKEMLGVLKEGGGAAGVLDDKVSFNLCFVICVCAGDCFGSEHSMT